jgi:magnesium chelatase family protein
MKRYVVNLSPADIRKEGPAYDLPIAIGVLVATEQLPPETIDGAMFIGELSLDGTLRHASGVLSFTYMAREQGFSTVYIPECNAAEAALIEGIDVIPVKTIGHLIEHLYQMNLIPPFDRRNLVVPTEHRMERLVDFQDIKGQEYLKRAMEVAASGGHHVLMSGPPGAGKTLIARALPGILPSMTPGEALDVTRIYSVANLLPSDRPLLQRRPFRAPHHTISQAGLVGGGTVPRPGEVTLAHRGILFLDEIGEFGQHTLEVLRQPLEDKVVTISRAKGSVTFPANIMLVGSMNPCPCGYYGDSSHACTCGESAVRRYQQRLSGPLLDRFDIHIDVQRVDYDKLTDQRRGESSAAIQERVETARIRQRERYHEHPYIRSNADLGPSEIDKFCQMEPAAEQLLRASLKKMQLSARAYHRMLKLSRTIADLAAAQIIGVEHVAEAIQYRSRTLLA